MLEEFNEGRSKTFYCIASTVLEIEELENALSEAKKHTEGLSIKRARFRARALTLHLL